MDLSNIQEKLSNYIYDYSVKEKELEQILNPKYIIKPKVEGLRIYRNNILFHVIDLLKDTYPSTAFILGEENFRFFIREFLTNHPPEVLNIDDYGKEFPFFLSLRKETQFKVPYIGDISRLDYFWANVQKEDEEIVLPKGLFKLWQSCQRKQEIKEKIEIDYKNTETVISTKIDKDLFLLKKSSIS